MDLGNQSVTTGHYLLIGEMIVITPRCLHVHHHEGVILKWSNTHVLHHDRTFSAAFKEGVENLQKRGMMGGHEYIFLMVPNSISVVFIYSVIHHP